MNLLAQIQTESVDYSGLKAMLPLSGGINSAALLCWLGEEIPTEKQPLELHLYYSHFTEHSPDTHQFVIDLICYANKKFKCEVNSKITWNSVNEFFRKEGFIPHPSVSPCSVRLKVLPSRDYFSTNEIDVELVGFVNSDVRRFRKLDARRGELNNYPILEWSKRDCLDYVKKVLGWYPAIYDLKDEKGKDLFSHNNCLPCKNMHPKQLALVGKHFPSYAIEAQKTTEMVGGYWGRDANMPDIFKCDVCERMG